MSENPKYVHAWNWFALHSQQRQNNINYAILVITGMLGLTGLLMQSNLFLVSAVLSFLGAVMCWLFYGVDRRNAHLVKISETFFLQFEKDQSDPTFEYKIMREADSASGYIKYSQFSLWFSIVMTVVFIGSAAYSIGHLCIR